jgi:hypothetical protein
VYTREPRQEQRSSGTRGPHFEQLAPITPRYAVVPVLKGFNWQDCLAGVEQGQWYLVVFRSVRRTTADDRLLMEYDDRAYAEALEGEGLLCYFRGSLNERRECLSLCVWEEQQQAYTAARAPLHLQAARVVREMYESYMLERYLIVKRPRVAAIELQAIT